MAARPLQPSEYEIRREVEALRDIRRRSVTPGALAIDPDLPNQSPPVSPTTTGYWQSKPSLATGSVDPTLEDIASDAGPSAGATNDTVLVTDVPNNPADDPFHLFWVPASVHPEIAPAEFRAFLKEHARSPPPQDSQDTTSRPSSSLLSPSTSLSRRKSMLSRQYKPKEGDEVEEETIVPLKRNRSTYRTSISPQLTISDLQKLDELAQEAQQSDDPSRLRTVLRRSLSLNLSPSAADLMDDAMDMGDEADAPIIVPPPGQILRRAARTKIRKAGLPGDGNGHRFGARRGPPRAQTMAGEPRTSSDMSSNDHSEADTSSDQHIPPFRRPAFSEEAVSVSRPDSYSEETSIYDAYARSEDEEPPYPTGASESSITPMAFTEEPPQLPADILPISDTLTPSIIEDELLPAPDPPAPVPAPIIDEPDQQPVLHQPQPVQHLAIPITEPSPSRTPSPSESLDRHQQTQAFTPSSSTTSIASAPTTRKEKDKRGLFGKWGSDKSSKKSKDRSGEKDKEKEKESSGFFGSLFGKKKQDSDYQSSMTGGASGRETAQALLGASKSKTFQPSSSPGLAPGLGGNPFARYPIHVERAIYRLSHIKLANPRRPLYEQVLISNLMFWYLGVINKAQNPSPSPTPVTNGATPAPPDADADKEQQEKEQKEKEQREKAEKERLERERQEKEQREMDMKKKESGRRPSLTKQVPNNRRAEMPIKGPQYEMQHRVMEQEYGPYGSAPSPRSPPAANPANGQYARGGPPPQQQYGNGSQKGPALPQKSSQEQFYYQSDQQQRGGLPPGAMPPVDQSGWMSQPTSLTSQQRPGQRSPSKSPTSANPGPTNHRSRSPPPQLPPNQTMPTLRGSASHEDLGERNSRAPGRSLSATATASMNGASLRKGNSAHAVAPRAVATADVQGEEEDVPLAVWQKQRRK